ncbi:MAG: hypothetical protein HND57_14370 [Planctomycetes bacterium]|nr:hypothetical protein [Planctomycetota bacterium]
MGSSDGGAVPVAPAISGTASADAGRLPFGPALSAAGSLFVPNEGQWSDDATQYGLHAGRWSIAFRQGEIALILRVVDAKSSGTQGPGYERDACVEQETITVSFVGANPIDPIGIDQAETRFNYFVGGPGRSSAADLPAYSRIKYSDLYDGIDLFVSANGETGSLKYEFHCAPGTDPDQIQLQYTNLSGPLTLSDTGNLNIETALGTLVDHAPIAHQTRDGKNVPLTVEYTLLDDASCGFSLGQEYDGTLPLVIDPEVEWMSYLGGGLEDEGQAVAVDSADNALVAGSTSSSDFEGRNNSTHGGWDAFVLKISPTGQLLWMTYLGGSGGDIGYGIAVDSADNALVTGHTLSTDFDGRNNSSYGGYGGDAYALRVSLNGQIEWMTYLGGSAQEGTGDIGYGITVDSDDNALLTGVTSSTDFEGRINSMHGSGYYADAFALKVSPSGQLQWMTYLGGSNGTEYGYGIAVDSADNALVTGYTQSTDFEGRNNSYHGIMDAFTLNVSPAGQVQWMTYLGGSTWDLGYGIAVDSADNVLVTGKTDSADFEGRNNSSHGRDDAFALKASPLGQVQWMTYLGGSEGDSGSGIAVDSAGNVLVAGDTGSADFDGRDNSNYGSHDAFGLAVNSSGQLQWMTYLGGSVWEYGNGIAVDSAGNVLVTGETASTDFAGRNNSSHGRDDAFIVKFNPNPGVQLSITPTCPDGGPINVSWTGATQDGQVALIYARCEGAFLVPDGNPCAQTELGLCSSQIQLARTLNSDANGEGDVNGNTGSGVCGGYLQLLDLTTCETSNVVLLE